MANFSVYGWVGRSNCAFQHRVSHLRYDKWTSSVTDQLQSKNGCLNHTNEHAVNHSKGKGILLCISGENHVCNHIMCLSC